jgi:hypothetical protein
VWRAFDVEDVLPSGECCRTDRIVIAFRLHISTGGWGGTGDLLNRPIRSVC